MINPNCKSCNNKEYKKDENCTIYEADDGLAVRCSSEWAVLKQKLVKDYSKMLTEGMKNKFKEINYIDLFAGPGLYANRNSGKLAEGSPLVASHYNYNNIILNDLNTNNCAALKKRLKSNKTKVHIYNKDANQLGSTINKMLAYNTLSFCLLDPSKMGDLHFSTIAELTHSRRVDLLINFPIHMDFKRGAYSHTQKYTNFLNTSNWIKVYEKYKAKGIPFIGNEIAELYLSQLETIGYDRMLKKKKYKNFFPVSTEKNRLIYYLLYVSKSERGYEFCDKMSKYAIQQQQLL